jgi:hypothetical protein
VKQELLILPGRLRSPPVFSGVRVTRSLVVYVCFVDPCLSFCTFSFGIVLSVLLRYADSDYPFGIFKLFNHRLLLSLKRKHKKEKCVTGCLLKFDNQHKKHLFLDFNLLSPA